ncbi:hypothetical protein CF651_09060 [Paenibacillus rigui]|uniref:Heparinase n=1 Tax=Paenibacillus rigui TaxID=554312 RepID=A0A229UT66_9BACL|nr:hypothetical protein CF651_09060 [Paenibacillus rigui]
MAVNRSSNVNTDSMYATIVQLNDRWTEETLPRQLNDAGSKYDGGVIDPACGIPLPNHNATPSVMAVWAASLVNPDSRYYRDAGLLESLDRASAYMLKQQHADGTISPGWTNYHSPPDTGFIVAGMAQFYRLLAAEAEAWEPLQPTAAKVRLFLERTVPAMLTGGCHTPNHRWVMTAALASLHELFPNAALLDRSEAWLAEGMDITEDGEWTERSNGIYNAVSDIMLYHTARLLKRPELLEPVRSNLRMMLYLVHPSGEIVTDYSGRQDFGKIHHLSNYFLIYRLMASHDNDPQFASMADYAARTLEQPGGVYNNEAVAYRLFPELRQDEIERAPLPEQYEFILNATYPAEQLLAQAQQAGHQFRIQHSRMHTEFGAPVVRYRDGETSITMMSETSSFFSLRHGKARLLGVQLSSSFSPGIVPMQRLIRTEQGTSSYRLYAEVDKGYNGTIPAELLPESSRSEMSPWYLLPHQHRPMTHSQTHRVQVDVQGVDHLTWQVRVSSDSPEDVFTQIAFIFGEEGQFVVEAGDKESVLQQAAPHAQFWKQGCVRYQVGEDRIELEAGAHEHTLTGVRDIQHPSGASSLLVNLITPFEHTFTLRLS